MIVVSDTTAITSLLNIGELELLSALCREVITSHAVQSELLGYHNTLPSWLMVRTTANHEMLEQLQQQLDLGKPKQ